MIQGLPGSWLQKRKRERRSTDNRARRTSSRTSRRTCTCTRTQPPPAWVGFLVGWNFNVRPKTAPRTPSFVHSRSGGRRRSPRPDQASRQHRCQPWSTPVCTGTTRRPYRYAASTESLLTHALWLPRSACPVVFLPVFACPTFPTLRCSAWLHLPAVPSLC